MLLSFFELSLAIRSVWPQRMSLKGFILLYILLLLAGIPVTLLSCIPYGLFGIPVAVCIYGLVFYKDTASQNVCMGIIGLVLSIMVDNLLTNFKNILFISLPLLNQQYISFGIEIINILLFYFITLFCGKLPASTSLTITVLFLSYPSALQRSLKYFASALASADVVKCEK